MNKIYRQEKDNNVSAVVVYVKDSDKYAYMDAACARKFKASELKDVFAKNILININGNLNKPVCFSVDENGFGHMVCFQGVNDIVDSATKTLLAEPDNFIIELVSDY